jgi:hypothetical protein
MPLPVPLAIGMVPNTNITSFNPPKNFVVPAIKWIAGELGQGLSINLSLRFLPEKVVWV